MPRPRATEHCHECADFDVISGLKVCLLAGFWPVSRDEARTSPRWCPRGHVIPGRAYPTFTPGLDPRSPDTVAAALRAR